MLKTACPFFLLDSHQSRNIVLRVHVLPSKCQECLSCNSTIVWGQTYGRQYAYYGFSPTIVWSNLISLSCRSNSARSAPMLFTAHSYCSCLYVYAHPCPLSTNMYVKASSCMHQISCIVLSRSYFGLC